MKAGSRVESQNPFVFMNEFTISNLPDIVSQWIGLNDVVPFASNRHDARGQGGRFESTKSIGCATKPNTKQAQNSKLVTSTNQSNQHMSTSLSIVSRILVPPCHVYNYTTISARQDFSGSKMSRLQKLPAFKPQHLATFTASSTTNAMPRIVLSADLVVWTTIQPFLSESLVSFSPISLLTMLIAFGANKSPPDNLKGHGTYGTFAPPVVVSETPVQNRMDLTRHGSQAHETDRF
jgi:hypothetical protein